MGFSWRFARLRMYSTATPANAITARPPTTLPAITPVLSLLPSLSESFWFALLGLEVEDGTRAEVRSAELDESNDVVGVGVAVKGQKRSAAQVAVLGVPSAGRTS